MNKLEKEDVEESLKQQDFRDFVHKGYASKDGYSLRTNPKNGEKEMFIAGSRHASDWFWNGTDAVLYGADKVLNKMESAAITGVSDLTGIPFPKHPVDIKAFEYLDKPRHKKQSFFEKIARDNNVQTIYGHSRGGAYVADMNVDATKVGLDAAMLIARDTSLANFEEGGGINPLGLFDEIIGLTGDQNITTDFSTFRPHQVWK